MSLWHKKKLSATVFSTVCGILNTVYSDFYINVTDETVYFNCGWQKHHIQDMLEFDNNISKNLEEQNNFTLSLLTSNITEVSAYELQL